MAARPVRCAGGHTVWIEPERSAVVVLRWLDPAHFAAAALRIAAALPAASPAGSRAESPAA